MGYGIWVGIGARTVGPVMAKESRSLCTLAALQIMKKTPGGGLSAHRRFDRLDEHPAAEHLGVWHDVLARQHSRRASARPVRNREVSAR